MEHITVCVCTFHQPMLGRLLSQLRRLHTGSDFTYSVVVADNDCEESARQTVAAFAAEAGIEVVYCIEPVQNFALVRNRALTQAKGELAAFINDDEFPLPDWLSNLYSACERYGADGALGPVLPHFDQDAPGWLRRGGFYERPRHPTGFKLEWSECRTGNVLIRRKVLLDLEGPFREEFRIGGEDQDFFRRLLARGHKIIWCDEAPVYESVPPHRWKRRFLLERALLRGNIALVHPKGRLPRIAKSAIAVPVYGMALPFMLLFGQHLFMKYLVKLFDHLGRLLALLKLNPVKERWN